MDCFEDTRHHCNVFRARKIRETMLAPVKRFDSVLQTSNDLTMVLNLNKVCMYFDRQNLTGYIEKVRGREGMGF